MDLDNSKINNVILLSLYPPPYGGIAQWTKRTLDCSSKYGINYIFVDESNKDERKYFGDSTKRNLFKDFKRALRIRKDLKKALKESDDSYIVHCCIPSLKFSMLRELFNLRLVKRFKRKYIIHFRSTVSNNVKTKFEKNLLKKLLKNSDRILLLNNQSFEFCNSILPNNKMIVLPNYISSFELNSEYTVRKEIKNILYVGMVTPEKGVDDIIDVAKYFPNVQFDIVGRVSQEITNYINECDCKNIIFHGQMDKDNISSFYKKSDLFLFLSRFSSEGFSNALCEAMGNGLPCIVTDWAANKDMIGSEIKEAIVKPHDIQSLKESIEYFDDIAVRKDASIRNFNKVKTNYTEEIVLKQLKNIYSSIK